MAIVFNCPQCSLPYRLPDKLAGKRATCKNPDCRKVIQIPEASSNGLSIAELGGIVPDEAKASAAPPVPTNPADVEAAALAALNEVPKEEAAPSDFVPVRCEYCAHEWSEPIAKAGKNVLCPNDECRQRVKVPMPKKGAAPTDWRTGGSNMPSLAKENFDKPDDVVSSEAKVVSKQAWQEGGGAEQDLEPISLKRRLFVASLIATPILVIGLGIFLLVGWMRSRGEESRFEPAIEEFEKGKEELSPAEAPLFSAILHLAGGEFALFPKNMEEDKALALALERFTRSRSDLQKAAQKDERRSAAGERHAIASELALSILGLGGAEGQVKDGSRFRWVPDAPSNRPLRINERTRSVHEELQKTLVLLAGADFDTRAVAMRRLSRALAQKGQPILAVAIPGFLFKDAEMPEAKAIAALEVFHVEQGSEEPRKVAEHLRALLANGAAGRNPAPTAAQALWAAVGVEKAPQLFAKPGNQPTDAQRLAFVQIYLLKDEAPRALELARKPGGSLPGQLRSLAIYAEWATDPSPAFDSAISLLNANKRPKQNGIKATAPPAALVLRLAQLAAAAGRPEQANQLADFIVDEGLKTWAKGSAIQMAAGPENKNKVEDSAFEVPDDSKMLRAGHAWGRLWQARQNTRALGASDATKLIANWPKGTLHPFGLAGVSLGQHDR